MARKTLALATLAATLLFAGYASAQESGPYKVLKIQLVGGEGGFDYVTADSDGRNLYVARSGPAGHIGVFNLDTLAQVGDIPDFSAHRAYRWKCAKGKFHHITDILRAGRLGGWSTLGSVLLPVSHRDGSRTAGCRTWVLLWLAAETTWPVFGAQPVTVEQLEQALASHAESDAQTASQLSEMQITKATPASCAPRPRRRANRRG